MASKKKASSQTGGMSSLFRDAGQQAKQIAITSANPNAVPDPSDRPEQFRLFNILDYIEQPWGLNMRLYPAQKFIVKLFYHLPLDDKLPTEERDVIKVTDMLNPEKIRFRLSEKEYLKFLYNEGRCNIAEQDHARRELLLSIGRRGGKTTLSGIFASYEVYRIISMGNPQKYYGLPAGNRIQIVSVATDKDQAGLLFNEVTSHVAKVEYFKPYVANNTQSMVMFRTPFDIERYGATKKSTDGKFVTFNGKASVRVTFKSSVAKGLRGSGNIVVIMDEMAHFIDKGSSGAKEIYDAITPSTAAFSPKDPNDSSRSVGDVEARIICISSPLNKSGKFYELYQTAMAGGEGAYNRIAIQAPTWEINPTLPASYYREKYHADPAVFMTEHGAFFSDRVRGWIERESDLLDCIDPSWQPQEVGVVRHPYQMGLDIALSGDGTAIAITHVEGDRIVLDYHELWVAGKDWRETNPHLTQPPTEYARTLRDVTRLDHEEIVNWVDALTRRFYIVDGIFDQWSGGIMETSFRKRGMTQFRTQFFTKDMSSRIYQNWKLLMYDKKFVLYDWPRPEDMEGRKRKSPLIEEILGLQAEQVSKNLVVVQKAGGSGLGDDVSDAIARSVWLSYERMSTTKYVAQGARAPQMGAYAPTSMSLSSYQRIRARRHGVVMERTVPRGLGGVRGGTRRFGR